MMGSHKVYKGAWQVLPYSLIHKNNSLEAALNTANDGLSTMGRLWNTEYRDLPSIGTHNRKEPDQLTY
jgi:hypothetical protein